MNKPTTENLDSLRRQLKRLVDNEKNRPPGRGVEKRRHKRHLYMVEARITYVKRFDQMSSCPNEFVVYTKDLSRSGLSFLHEHEMYLGEIAQVDVGTGDDTRCFVVKITRCRRAGLKVFNIAGEFITETEAEEAKKQTSPDDASEKAEDAGDSEEQAEAESSEADTEDEEPSEDAAAESADSDSEDRPASDA